MMRFIAPQNKENLTTVYVLLLLLAHFLHLFYTLNSMIFVDRSAKIFLSPGRKNISCPRAQGTLATPLG